MTYKQFLIMICLAAIWGASFLFSKMAVGYFGAVPLSASRSLIAAVSLFPILVLRGRLPEFLKIWKHLVLLGLISTAIPFSLITLSTQYTSAGFASILNALTPLFSALLAWLWLKEDLSRAAAAGIGLGFIGVMVMVLDRETINTSLPVLPIMAGLGATFFYGLTGNYSRRNLRGVSSLTISAGCQVFSALFLLPVAWFSWPSTSIPWDGWVLSATLGILCTGVAFILYFYLLDKVGVARTVVVTYLVPVFAMLWGHLVLDESVTLKMAMGAALIMTGIGLTTRPGKST